MTFPAGDGVKQANSIDTADEMLETLAKRGSRAIKILVGGLIIISLALSVAVGYLIYNNMQETTRIHSAVMQAVAKQQQQIQTQCDFYSLISQLPLMNNTTKTGVTLIADSRAAYVGLDCKPSLIPPSTELIKLAQKFSIPLVG